MSAIVPALNALHSHSIFIPPTPSTSKTPAIDFAETDLDVPSKIARLTLRDKDAIVAHGSEIRITNIAGDDWEEHDGQVGRYKTFTGRDLGFEVKSLVVNGDGRLLAVVGERQVSVVVLPKPGSVGLTSGQLAVKSFAIDRYQFSTASSSLITKVLWHPWSQSHTSLWILTSDGKLREYDVLNPDDPAQTYSFLPSSPASRSRFSAVDPLSRYATSFSFAPFNPTLGVGATMVHVLCANGDVHYMGPIIPLKALVPIQWIQALRLSLKRDNMGREIGAWVENLVKQVRESEERKKDMVDKSHTPTRRGDREDEEEQEGMIRIHPPHLTSSGGPAPGRHVPLARQGPIAYDPAPQEIGAEIDEDIASDLVFFEHAEGEVIMVVAWAGGRVDIGVIVEPFMPKWHDGKDKNVGATMAIVESVLLPFPSNAPETLAANAPVFLTDPLHQDVIYVQHSFGLDSISVMPMISVLIGGDDSVDLPSSNVTRLVDSTGTPATPIIGAVAFCNIAFGHALIALASTYQLAAVELEFKPALKQEEELAETAAEPEAQPAENPSLLSAKPLDLAPIMQPTKSYGADLRSLARGVSISPLNTISRDMLRQIVDIISHIQTRIHAVRKASQAIENHLDLCVKEYSRQIRVITSMRETISAVGKAKSTERVSRMVEKQQQLAQRLDGVVRNLTGTVKPELGESEKRWFDELDRIGNRLRGVDGQSGLMSRFQTLQQQLSSLRPAMSYHSRQDQQNESVDEKEIVPLGQTLQEKSEEIRRLLRRMDALSVRMDTAMEERREGL